ncbi:MAG: hypothetical protein JNL08_02725 [Planctomycetes bacterium]|nr:hypothetical protein [Planctomycetota bacterium]
MILRGVVAWWCVASLAAQTEWSLRGGAARVRLAGPAGHWLMGPVDHAAGLPAGDYEVHFGADAAGKPRSLQFRVPAGARVHLAAEPAAAVAADAAAPAGEQDAAPSAANYRVVAVTPPGADGVLGLVARRAEGAPAVHFVWDRAVGEFRLERAGDADTRTLAKAPAPRGDDDLHTMALQVEGFRIEAFWDEAPVLRAMYGGMAAGGHGAFTKATSAAFATVERQPVASARTSCALVVEEHAATLHAAVTALPGHWHVLEVVLDQAQPPLPVEASGLEPWLLRGGATPVVLMADWRGSYGPGGIGEVGREGTFTSRLEWPPLPGLRHQCGVVRALLVSPRGEVLAERIPGLPFCIP